MSEKISIACPSCHKGYSVPANLGDRKLKCKACGLGFRLSDLLPPKVTPVPAQQEPKIDSSVRGAKKTSLQGMFKSSIPNAIPGSAGAGFNPYDGVAQPRLGRIEHRTNSKMIFAIIGSILACILIIPACYVISFLITGTLMKERIHQRGNQKQGVSSDQPVLSSVLVVAKSPQKSSESLSWKSE